MKSFGYLCAVLLLSLSTAFAGDQKLIALTFDDGPRPYILYGYNAPGVKPVPSLLDLLDKNHAKATFFVMGWRLLPNTYGERHEYRTDKTCLDAAREVVRRGHEIENHTFSHVQLKQFERTKGEAAAIADVDHGAQLIKAVTGSQPHYLRPPDWIMPSDLEKDLQHRGWTVLTISSEMPVALRDINSLDYLCAGKATQCPKPSLEASVLKTIEAREKKGITTHLIAFHELSTTVAALEVLLPELRARGYQFVTLQDYMNRVGGKSAPATIKGQP
jgi:peptidoglycan/xylan/chitin deacetylase (PgdA/CDA1 family)